MRILIFLLLSLNMSAQVLCPPCISETCLDTDSDGICDVDDNCISTANASQANSDADTHGDACDNCPNDDNEDQANFDGDSLGDVCDLDDDNDGVSDATDCLPFDGTQSAVIGSSCDDGNACTYNDKVVSGCGCSGTVCGSSLFAINETPSDCSGTMPPTQTRRFQVNYNSNCVYQSLTVTVNWNNAGVTNPTYNFVGQTSSTIVFELTHTNIPDGNYYVVYATVFYSGGCSAQTNNRITPIIDSTICP